jgi:hypothetical protein
MYVQYRLIDHTWLMVVQFVSYIVQRQILYASTQSCTLFHHYSDDSTLIICTLIQSQELKHTSVSQTEMKRSDDREVQIKGGGDNQPISENHRKGSLIVSRTIVTYAFPELSLIRLILMISFCESHSWVCWTLGGSISKPHFTVALDLLYTVEYRDVDTG